MSLVVTGSGPTVRGHASDRADLRERRAGRDSFSSPVVTAAEARERRAVDRRRGPRPRCVVASAALLVIHSVPDCKTRSWLRARPSARDPGQVVRGSAFAEEPGRGTGTASSPGSVRTIPVRHKRQEAGPWSPGRPRCLPAFTGASRARGPDVTGGDRIRPDRVWPRIRSCSPGPRHAGGGRISSPVVTAPARGRSGGVRGEVSEPRRARGSADPCGPGVACGPVTDSDHAPTCERGRTVVRAG